MGYKMPKRVLRKRSLRSVRRRLFGKTSPTHVVGDGYIPTKYGVSGKRAGRLTFAQKISKNTFPPFTQQQHQVGGIDHNNSNRQSVTHIPLFQKSDAVDALTKLKNVLAGNGQYTEYFPEYTTAAAVDSPSYSQMGVKSRLLSNLYQFTFINTCSATCELDFILVRPAKDIATNDLLHNNPYTWWSQCNERCQLSNDVSLPNAVALLDNATDPEIIGDRPDKGATKSMFSKWWKIIRTDSVKLQPGQLFKWTHLQNMNCILDWDDTLYSQNMPKLGLSLLIIGKGQVVNGSTAGFADVGYSNFQVSYTWNTYTKARLEKFFRPIKYYIGTDAPDIAEVNQTFYNPDSRTTVGYTENQ